MTIYDLCDTDAVSEWSNPGIRGDFWGGHAGLTFGAVSAILLFAAVVLQWHELKEQRKELVQSRLVAESQMQEFRHQNVMNLARDEQNRVERLAALITHAKPGTEVESLVRLAILGVGRMSEIDPVVALDSLRLFWFSINPNTREGSWDNVRLPEKLHAALENMVANHHPKLKNVRIDWGTGTISDNKNDETWLSTAKNIISGYAV